METGLIILAIVVAVAITTISYTIGADRNTKVGVSKGALHINYYTGVDYKPPGIYLTLNVPVEEITKQKKVVLDVNVIYENSQE